MCVPQSTVYAFEIYKHHGKPNLVKTFVDCLIADNHL